MVIHLVAKENNTMATSVKELPKGMGEQPLALRLWLSCGAIGPLLFIVVFLIHEMITGEQTFSEVFQLRKNRVAGVTAGGRVCNA
jgi:hypothetical protein